MGFFGGRYKFNSRRLNDFFRQKVQSLNELKQIADGKAGFPTSKIQHEACLYYPRQLVVNGADIDHAAAMYYMGR